MTREEAIICLKGIKCYGRDTFTKQSDWQNSLDMVIKALEQESFDVSRWIPVSERLPEKEGLYLVSVKNDHQRRYSKTCYFSRKNWFARQDIIAWMPLPEPYKAESEDKE